MKSNLQNRFYIKSVIIQFYMQLNSCKVIYRMQNMKLIISKRTSFTEDSMLKICNAQLNI